MDRFEGADFLFSYPLASFVLLPRGDECHRLLDYAFTFKNVKLQFVASNMILQSMSNFMLDPYCCTKEGDFEEYGQIPRPQGSRSELEDFKAAVKGGMISTKELMENHTEVLCAKYPRFVKKYLNAQRTVDPTQAHPLNDWQQLLHTELARKPDDRSVTERDVELCLRGDCEISLPLPLLRCSVARIS